MTSCFYLELVSIQKEENACFGSSKTVKCDAIGGTKYTLYPDEVLYGVNSQAASGCKFKYLILKCLWNVSQFELSLVT